MHPSLLATFRPDSDGPDSPAPGATGESSAAAPARASGPAPAGPVAFLIPGPAAGSSMIFARRQAEALRGWGLRVELFHLASRLSPWRLALEWLRFREWARRRRPAVVHAQFGTMTALFAVLAAGRVPVVITYRGSDLNPVSGGAPGSLLRSLAGRLLSQLAALGAARIVCVSRELGGRLWWRRQRVTVLPTGVDTAEFFPGSREVARRELGWEASERVVLFNAGHDPRNKRLDLAVAAVQEARGELPDLRLEVLRGEVPPDRVPVLMRAADCLLVASDREGSPTVIQEALASNLPVVSVEAGDAVERLEGLAEARIAARDPQALARAVVELTRMPRRARSRARAVELSTRAIAGRLAEIYRAIERPEQPVPGAGGE